MAKIRRSLLSDVLGLTDKNKPFFEMEKAEWLKLASAKESICMLDYIMNQPIDAKWEQKEHQEKTMRPIRNPIINSYGLLEADDV